MYRRIHSFGQSGFFYPGRSQLYGFTTGQNAGKGLIVLGGPATCWHSHSASQLFPVFGAPARMCRPCTSRSFTAYPGGSNTASANVRASIVLSLPAINTSWGSCLFVHSILLPVDFLIPVGYTHSSKKSSRPQYFQRKTGTLKKCIGDRWSDGNKTAH